MKTISYYWAKMKDANTRLHWDEARRYATVIAFLQGQSYDWAYFDMISGFASDFFSIDYRIPSTYGLGF